MGFLRKKRPANDAQLEEPAPRSPVPGKIIVVSSEDVDRERRKRSLEDARNRGDERLREREKMDPLDDWLMECDALDNPANPLARLTGTLPGTQRGGRLRKLDILRWVAGRAAGYKDYQIEQAFSVERKELTRIDYAKAADAWERIHPKGRERMRQEISRRLGLERDI